MKLDNKKSLTESGFTLVEIAIVLVIIGSSLGGILRARR
jgi:prepilin-type N-terminal cleavage/methylation domain-containing protein